MEIKSPRVNLVIDRDKAAAMGLNVAERRDGALRRARPAVVLDDLRRDQPVPGPARARSEISGARRLARADRLQGALGRARAARVGRPLQGDRRAADDQPLGAARGGDDLVQPAAERLARRRRRSHQAGGRQSPAGDRDDELHGIGEGVPGVDAESGAAALCRDRRRLHRARDALRELRPPAHDSLRPPLGRPRRARHALAVPRSSSTSTPSSASSCSSGS